MWNILSGSVAAQPMSLQADPELPPAHEFVTSAGFGGAAALLAAIILAGALLVIARNNRSHHAQHLDALTRHQDAIRDEHRRSDALASAWRRLEWVVDTAGLEPASSQGITLGLGPELATEVLRGILADADRLGDEALGNAATVHLSQLSLVLAQQAGPLTDAVTTPADASNKPAHIGAADTEDTTAARTDSDAPATASSNAPARTARSRRNNS